MPRDRTDLLELEVVAPEEWEAVALELTDGSRLPTQEIRRQEPMLWETTLAGAEVPAVIARRLHGRELFGRYVNGYRIEDGRAVLEVGDEPDPDWLDVEQLVRDVTFATAEGEWNLRGAPPPKRTSGPAVPVPSPAWTRRRAVKDPGAIPGTPPF